jgi:hypothetical protein
MKIASFVLALLALPIGLYITHSLLVAINADRLLMFLFWINIPIYVALRILDWAVTREGGKK